MTKVAHEAAGDEAARLVAAAEGAQQVRPPGIVRVVSIDEDDSGAVVVVTDEPDAGAHVDVGDGGGDGDASVFAAAADALARLHAAGVVHGAIDARSLRRDAAGRAVLPLPAWRDGEWRASATDADDVDALCGLVGERDARSAADLAARLVAPSPRVLRRTRDRAAGGVDAGDDRRTAPSPRSLRAARDRGAAPTGVRRRGAVVGGLTAVAGVVTMAIAVLSPSSTARPTLTTATTSTGSATTASSVRATVPASADRVVSLGGRRYELGVPGDLVLIGDWSCGAARRPTPALARPSTGDVLVFADIADGATATPVTRIDGITAAGRANGADGCDRLLVDTPTGTVDVTPPHQLLVAVEATPTPQP